MPDRWALSLWSRGFGAVQMWLAVALLFSLFGVILFKPQQIANKMLFRLSYILFALHVVIPAILEGVMWTYELNPRNLDWLLRNPDVVVAYTMPLANMVGTLFFGISLICALSSLRFGHFEPPVSKE